MTRHRVLTIAAGAAAVSLAIPASVALRYGADPGYSGGPAGNGQGCPACHTFDTGPGSVALIGAPPRYRPGAVYDLTVRVSDPEQAGAGFEISAENAAGHQGAWVITDPLHTHYPADVFADYVTHTIDGFEESVATWADNGGAYAYTMQWQAPDNDAGPVTL
ncbi:MAG: choice-of-anchor V domain-containing protein, partial [Phycisphaerae bacterium]